MRPILTNFSSMPRVSRVPILKSTPIDVAPPHPRVQYSSKSNTRYIVFNLALLFIFVIGVGLLLRYLYLNKPTELEKQQQLLNLLYTINNPNDLPLQIMYQPDNIKRKADYGVNMNVPVPRDEKHNLNESNDLYRKTIENKMPNDPKWLINKKFLFKKKLE